MKINYPLLSVLRAYLKGTLTTEALLVKNFPYNTDSF